MIFFLNVTFCFVCVSKVLGNFQCQDILLIFMFVGQGPSVLAVGAGWFVGRFSLIYPFFSLSLLIQRYHSTVSRKLSLSIITLPVRTDLLLFIFIFQINEIYSINRRNPFNRPSQEFMANFAGLSLSTDNFEGWFFVRNYGGLPVQLIRESQDGP